MSSLVYPTLPGLTLDQVRRYEWKTLLSEADSGVMTTVARRRYPVIKYEHTYEVLRRYASPDELQQIVGLYNSLQGQFDTFLFTDPEFNTITPANMAQYGQFGTGTGAQTVYQLAALFQQSGGPGSAEIVQNLNGAASLYINRFGLPELMSPVSRTNYLLQSQTLATTWTDNQVTITSNSSTAPDGTVTADAVKETAVTNVHGISQAATLPSAAETITLTVYLNPNLTRTWGFLSMTEGTGGTVVSAYYNLSGGGAVGTVATGANWSAASATITPANNGYYCCTLTATKTNAATAITAAVNAATANGTNNYAGNTADGVTVWGAQMEVGTLGSTMYLPTVAATVTQLDYTLGATCIVTYTSAPALNALLLWAGSWYQRCRFEDDAIAWTKFMNQLWKATVKFRSVKL